MGTAIGSISQSILVRTPNPRLGRAMRIDQVGCKTTFGPDRSQRQRCALLQVVGRRS